MALPLQTLRSKEKSIMSMGIYSALTGISIREQELETLAHNIANSNTTGFKENRLSFQAVVGKHDASGQSTPFAEIKKRKINFELGSTVNTGNALDLALQGHGFFEVQTERGTRYTRNGTFAINSEGKLVTTAGHLVMGTNGDITIPQGSTLQVGKQGHIMVDRQEIGQIKIVKFSDPQTLQPEGANLYETTDSSSQVSSEGTHVLQGELEMSNVNTVYNLVKLIEVTRRTQVYQRVIQSYQQLDQEAATNVGRVA